VNAVEDLHANVHDEPSLRAFMLRYGVEPDTEAVSLVCRHPDGSAVHDHARQSRERGRVRDRKAARLEAHENEVNEDRDRDPDDPLSTNARIRFRGRWLDWRWSTVALLLRFVIASGVSGGVLVGPRPCDRAIRI
jgi:hypothetical protein